MPVLTKHRPEDNGMANETGHQTTRQSFTRSKAPQRSKNRFSDVAELTPRKISAGQQTTCFINRSDFMQ